jgi:hypothetical protein
MVKVVSQETQPSVIETLYGPSRFCKLDHRVDEQSRRPSTHPYSNPSRPLSLLCFPSLKLLSIITPEIPFSPASICLQISSQTIGWFL